MTDPIENQGPPDWIETVSDATDRSVLVTVRRDGGLVRYVIPRRTLIESRNGHTNGHATAHGGSRPSTDAD